MAAFGRTPKNVSPSDLVKRIREDLAAAEVRLAQTTRAQTEAAERSVIDPSAAKEYAAATSNVALVRDEIARLRIALAAAGEKARQAEADRIVSEKAALIGRIEAKAAERNKVAAELAGSVAAMDAAFRKLVAIGRELTAGGRWGRTMVPPAC